MSIRHGIIGIGTIAQLQDPGKQSTRVSRQSISREQEKLASRLARRRRGNRNQSKYKVQRNGATMKRAEDAGWSVGMGLVVLGLVAMVMLGVVGMVAVVHGAGFSGEMGRERVKVEARPPVNPGK